MLMQYLHDPSLRICFSVVVGDCVVDILYRDHLRPYLFCLGREEVLRLVLSTNLCVGILI